MVIAAGYVDRGCFSRGKRMLILIIVESKGAESKSGQTIELTESRPYVLGRSKQADFHIDNRAVSRLHTQFTPRPGNWLIKDLGTRNGTWLNGVRLEEETPIKEGDRIEIGNLTMVAMKMEPPLPYAEETWVDKEESSDGFE